MRDNCHLLYFFHLRGPCNLNIQSYLISQRSGCSNLAAAPPVQINHNGRPATSGDDPDDVLAALVHFLVFSPCRDEGTVAGRKGLFLMPL